MCGSEVPGGLYASESIVSSSTCWKGGNVDRVVVVVAGCWRGNSWCFAGAVQLRVFGARGNANSVALGGSTGARPYRCVDSAGDEPGGATGAILRMAAVPCLCRGWCGKSGLSGNSMDWWLRELHGWVCTLVAAYVG